MTQQSVTIPLELNTSSICRRGDGAFVLEKNSRAASTSFFHDYVDVLCKVSGAGETMESPKVLAHFLMEVCVPCSTR
jgi:hypothetical protein